MNVASEVQARVHSGSGGAPSRQRGCGCDADQAEARLFRHPSDQQWEGGRRLRRKTSRTLHLARHRLRARKTLERQTARRCPFKALLCTKSCPVLAYFHYVATQKYSTPLTILQILIGIAAQFCLFFYEYVGLGIVYGRSLRSGRNEAQTNHSGLLLP